jgi:hypothetical protein
MPYLTTQTTNATTISSPTVTQVSTQPPVSSQTKIPPSLSPISNQQQPQWSLDTIGTWAFGLAMFLIAMGAILGRCRGWYIARRNTASDGVLQGMLTTLTLSRAKSRCVVLPPFAHWPVNQLLTRFPVPPQPDLPLQSIVVHRVQGAGEDSVYQSEMSAFPTADVQDATYRQYQYPEQISIYDMHDDPDLVDPQEQVVQPEITHINERDSTHKASVTQEQDRNAVVAYPAQDARDRPGPRSATSESLPATVQEWVQLSEDHVVTLHARYSTDSWSSQKVEVLSQVDRRLQDIYSPQDSKRRFQAYEEDAGQAVNSICAKKLKIFG